MPYGNIEVEEKDIEGISYFAGNVENTLDGINQTFSYEFQPLVNTNLCANGIKTIDKQSKKIQNNIGSFKKNIVNQINSFLELENILANEASKIKIPRDFSITDSYQNKTEKPITLDRDNNGKIINENKSTNMVKENFNANVTNEDIKNIINDSQPKIENINDNFTSSKIKLNHIKNSELTTQKINEVYDIDKINLENINHNTYVYDEKTDEWI